MVTAIRAAGRLSTLPILPFGFGATLAYHRLTTDTATRTGETTPLDPGERTTTGNGRLSFTAPKGWTTRPCRPRGGPDCVQVSPPGAAEGDTVSVLASPRNPVEGTPMDLLLIDDPAFMVQDPSVKRLTLDGAKAVRMDISDLPEMPEMPELSTPGLPDYDVMVFGVVPGSTDEFMINCGHDRLAAEMRAGCDLIVESLRFRR